MQLPFKTSAAIRRYFTESPECTAYYKCKRNTRVRALAGHLNDQANDKSTSTLVTSSWKLLVAPLFKVTHFWGGPGKQ